MECKYVSGICSYLGIFKCLSCEPNTIPEYLFWSTCDDFNILSCSQKQSNTAFGIHIRCIQCFYTDNTNNRSFRHSAQSGHRWMLRPVWLNSLCDLNVSWIVQGSTGCRMLGMQSGARLCWWDDSFWYFSAILRWTLGIMPSLCTVAVQQLWMP